MKIGKKQFLIRNNTLGKVKGVLGEFENKYQNFKSRWDFELLSQDETVFRAQMVDHGFETPRGKGQSDSPVYTISLEPRDSDVALSWTYRWKRSKRNLSWTMFSILLASRLLIFLLIRGDRLVLFMSVWAYCSILYGAWVLENYRHGLLSQQVFREMLSASFRDAGAVREEAPADQIPGE